MYDQRNVFAILFEDGFEIGIIADIYGIIFIVCKLFG
jgi:hypothetical protein